MELLVRRFMDEEAPPGVVWGLAAVPIVGYLAATILPAWRLVDEKIRESVTANRHFLLLGLTSFAVLLPIGLLLFRSHALADTLQQISPLLILLGLPCLTAGVISWRHTTGRDLGQEQTVGVSLGVVGVAITLACVGVAWPHAASFMVTAGICGVALLFVASRFQVPEGQLPAALFLVTAALVAFHAVVGHVDWTAGSGAELFAALFSVGSANALVPLAGGAILVAWLWQKAERPHDAKWWMIAAGCISVASLVLALVYGFGRWGDPGGVTWTLAFYALASAIVAWRIDSRIVSWSTIGILFFALAQGIVFAFPDLPIAQPWVAVLLIHATLMMTGLAVVARRNVNEPIQLVAAMRYAAIATSAVAACCLFTGVLSFEWSVRACYLLWLAGVVVALAHYRLSSGVFGVAQFILFAAAFCGATHLVSTTAWYTQASYPWLDPWFLQVQGIALALQYLLWQALRIGLELSLSRRAEQEDGGERMPTAASSWNRLISPPGATFDQLCQGIVVVLAVVLSVYAAVPGVAQELSPIGNAMAERHVPLSEEFEFPAIPAEHAAGLGGWLLLLAAAALLLVGLGSSLAQVALIGLIFVGAMACPLAATWWVDDVATASALRWLSTGFVLLASLPIWFRKTLSNRWSGMNRRLASSPKWLSAPPSTVLSSLLVALIGGMYATMAGYVSIAAVGRAGVSLEGNPVFYAALSMSMLLAMTYLASKTQAGAQAAIAVAQKGGWPANRVLPWNAIALVLASGIIAVTCLFTVTSALQQYPIVGPKPGSWFSSVGPGLSYGAPLIVLAITLLGYAIREHSSRYAFAAGMLGNVVATLLYLVDRSQSGLPLDGVAWVQIAQINTLVCGLYALLWFAAERWLQQRGTRRTDDADRLPAVPRLLTLQAGLTIVLGLLPLCGTVVGIFVRPSVPSFVVAAGAVWGWLALAIAVAAAVVLLKTNRLQMSGHLWGIFCLSLGVLIPATVSQYDQGDWLAYHALMLGIAASALLVPAGRTVASMRKALRITRGQFIPWSSVVGFLSVVFSARALWGDPHAPYWTIGGFLAMSLLGIWLAWQSLRRRYVWWTAVLMTWTTSLWWLDAGHRWTPATGLAELVEFLLINVVAIAGVGVVSLAIERRRMLPAGDWVPRRQMFGFHRFANWAGVLGIWLTIAMGLTADVLSSPLNAAGWLHFTALVAIASLAVATLWDPARRFPVANSYCVGLAATGIFLDGLNVNGRQLAWSATLALAAFTLATSYLWSQRGKLRPLLQGRGISGIDTSTTVNPLRPGSGHRWLLTANSLVIAVVTTFVFWIVLDFADFRQRIVAAYAVLASAFSLALLAQGKLQSGLRYAALGMGILFAIACGWATMPVDIESALLHRFVAAGVALAVVIPIYGFGLVKLWRRENAWTEAAQRLTPLIATVASLMFIAVVGIEAVQAWEHGSVTIRMTALVAVAVALGGMTVCALLAALLPGRDPLGLSERGRTAYVYAAEALLGLLFLHIRLTMPWMFAGWFVQLWPLAVVAIAFIGVGIGEWSRRQQTHVLAEPLHRTGAFLPLLPVLGFWFQPSGVNYSILLLAVGSLYAVVSILRRSYWYGILALLAANGSFWYLLQTSEGFRFWEHPQLWLIPPALCVLVGSQLNRRRLTAEQLTAVRYLAAIVIYASSTADIFVNGVGEAPWLPIVLAGLAICGVFAGILLRVRAFLYLGTTFLIVALFTIIWHAAVDREMTWIWWVTGIVCGTLIITLFGIFEKKRDELLPLIGRVKQWDA